VASVTGRVRTSGEPASLKAVTRKGSLDFTRRL
jgi:hypothetical protein